VRIDVVGAEDGCDAEPLYSETIGLEGEALTASLAMSGVHAFADGFFVLPPGSYRVCGTPLAGESPSEECGTAESEVAVEAGTTSEVVLISQCTGGANGAVDVVVSLNDAPVITELSLDPSKFITVCESVHLVATASDPNDDALSYSWTVSSGPEGSTLHSDGAAATFFGPVGDYVLTLGVSDGHGGSASLEFPIHVTDAVCEVSPAVQDIFTARCTPSHTVGSSGGLHLDPASSSFANLVGVHSGSAACADRVRVIPGDAASSYLVAKLRGTAGICGVPMPRNQPALPEEEIQVIEDWINGLPH
jgi:hypothetical protein